MDINLKDFVELISKYAEKECCVMDNEKGHISSHSIEGTITIGEETEDDVIFYTIEDIELDYLLGCRCPSGITIKVKRDED